MTSLLELTADIVAAHVSNNSVAVNDLAPLISSVHNSLSGIDRTVEIEASAEPAVPVKDALTRNKIRCLECGWSGKTLKRHLSSSHDMTPEDYRERFELRADYPMITKAYSESRSQMAKDLGLGRKPAA
ncbi:MucR family transcriptional regulator [Novosphingopyxis sp.]|uniref:MucR family transcriptional regulator n=1 Tax=Novosphingopyxis sp. TaxID=2709690 RepID=UPI003B5908E6